MSVSFKFCGYLKNIADKDSFKRDDTKVFNTGWMIRTLKFIGINGSNSNIFEVSSGYFGNEDRSVNESKEVIYTLKNGATKVEGLSVKYKDRFDPEIVKIVPSYKKWSINLNNPGESDPMKSESYLFEYDYIECLLKNLLSRPDLDKLKVAMTGTMDFQYSEKDGGRFYRHFNVNSIYLAKPEDEEEMCIHGSMYYGRDCWDESGYEDTGKINAYVYIPYYDPMYRNDSCKGKAFANITLDIVPSGAEAEKQYTILKKRFTTFEDEEFCMKTNFYADVINGSSISRVTYDDLSDEAKENIDMGISTLEDEIAFASSGKEAVGPKETSYRLRSTRKTTVGEVSDYELMPPVHDVKTANSSSGINSLDDDDDDEILI